MQKTKKGFTLIELLVVIAVLAVLATAVVLILNPAQLVKQGRDSTRISDLAALNSAVALWLSDINNPSSVWVATSTCTGVATPYPTGVSIPTISASTTVTGGGWVNIDFANISAGSPLSKLPIDPSNSDPNVYCWRASSTALLYKIEMHPESIKFSKNGGSDVTSNTKDGGNDNDWYEIGNSLGW